ncbi:uncharacterized protein LOC129603588 [Betta splendens]|uniref:Uncharacterized protein LOC114850774 n=1 Tax=Betta splendens TaxID=158456 RepID=A0A6P7LWB1_BETSP|nr:uncharacterized protein LOC114850774 [Betta splendens]XP_055361665.1 uncharacterized protein LOC129603588 [Betta splendens]
MARLSYAIYMWDQDDLALLEKAKRAEEGRDSYIRLSAKELARHCRRYTRGAAETERLIQELLDQFWDLRNDLGVVLIDHERMEAIWSVQRRHLSCIQDPPGVALYTKTGELTKGGIRLPVYRCARGSTSLESFHLHLNGFIPGTSASALHFQVYLLEGLVRWNEDRGRASVEGAQRLVPRCYDALLQDYLKRLTQEFMGMTVVETYTQPGEYTGELIGVEYLFSQTGAVLEDLGRDPDAPDGLDEADVEVVDNDEGEEDEGFGELQDMQFLHDQPAAAAAAAAAACSADTDPVSREESAVETGMDVAEGDGPVGVTH